jgi:branched-chain amino acid transport system ATP-binding protein
MTSILQLIDVYKYFDGSKVINGIDLSVSLGEKHALIGPNGAGKSTIFNLITGRYSVSRGRILFKGRNIAGLPPHKISHLGIARSFQIINVFKDMTVFENVRNAIVARHGHSLSIFSLIGNLRGIREETDCLLERIHLTPVQRELAGTLPYGQQRALEIGLTIALDPELILLDEPTAGMTPGETREVIKLIRETTQGKTLMIVEHDMEVVFDLADRISVIHLGKNVTTATPEEIRQNVTVKGIYLGSSSYCPEI